MNKELLKKYKDLEKKIKVVVLVLQKTSTLVNTKIQAQLNLLTKSNEPGKVAHDVKQTITHYTHLMNSLGLMTLTSIKAAFFRKMLKTATKGKSVKLFDKWKDDVVDFWNHATSTIEPLEHFASIYDPKSLRIDSKESSKSNENNKVQNIGDIVKVVKSSLDEIKKMTDTLSKDKKSLDSSNKKVLESLNKKLGGYDIHYETDPVDGGSDKLDDSKSSRTDTYIQSNMAKIEIIKDTFQNENYNNPKEYYETIVKPTLDKMIPSIVLDNELSKTTSVLDVLHKHHIFDIFDDDIRPEFDAYLKKHSKQYEYWIDISKEHRPDKDLFIGPVQGGGFHDDLLKIREIIDGYQAQINQLNEIDTNILVGMAIEEFQNLNSLNKIPDFEENHEKFVHDYSLIKSQELARPDILVDIRNTLNAADGNLHELENIAFSSAKLQIPPKSTAPNEHVRNIQDAINMMDAYMKQIQQILPTIRNAEEISRGVAEPLENFNRHIKELIGPRIDTCIMRPGRIIRALIYKDIVPHILANRFAGTNKDNQKNISDINQNTTSVIIHEKYPQVELYKNGLRISELVKLANALLNGIPLDEM